MRVKTHRESGANATTGPRTARSGRDGGDGSAQQLTRQVVLLAAQVDPGRRGLDEPVSPQLGQACLAPVHRLVEPGRARAAFAPAGQVAEQAEHRAVPGDEVVDRRHRYRVPEV